MKDLIPISYDSDRPTVLARDLHDFLEVETPYHKWFPRMCEYGFTENQDYSVTDKFVHNPAGGPQSCKDAQLTIDMAKEICMIQRNERGKQARRYFLEVERQWNSPDAIMHRALTIANDRVKHLMADNARLTVDLEIARPKAEYFDELVDRNLLTNFRETAKQLEVKEKDFVSFLLGHKYIYRDKRGRLMPYAEKNNGLFEIKETINEKTGWSGTQTLITPKGRETFRLLVAGATEREC